MDQIIIQQLIHHFANSFDNKDWQGLENCFMPQIHTDYSDLRGTPPEMMGAAQFVLLRQAALKNLRTHHLCGNYEVEIRENKASCQTSMLIYRLDEATHEQFTSHCYYTFNLERVEAGWKINAISQKVFWNEGNPSIHKGVAAKRL
jgi:3-phenylpropionate/cinnamic acid dioxygenase small subunit